MPLPSSSNYDSVAMDINPAYGDFTSDSIKTDEDTGLDYEVMDTQARQVKTDDIEMVTNPAYAETNFN